MGWYSLSGCAIIIIACYFFSCLRQHQFKRPLMTKVAYIVLFYTSYLWYHRVVLQCLGSNKLFFSGHYYDSNLLYGP